ncbi:MAG: SDR family NAD(P)-dependent oxidoreductase [Algiphilus sp.]
MTEFPAGAAWVLGGSGGIGSVIARCLAEGGSDVAIGYRSKGDKAEAVAANLRESGRKASTHALDVTDPASIDAALKAVLAEHGQLHTVVFAAGPVVEQMLLADTPVEAWRKAVDTEQHGLFQVIKACLPALRESQGSVVHVGSAGDRWWPPMDGLSVIPKAANEALIRGIAKEEGANGVRANSVLVGVIEAGMFLELLERGVFDEHWIRETKKLLALKRWGKPEDIGEAVRFLASSRANYITGEQINVSGGFGV